METVVESSVDGSRGQFFSKQRKLNENGMKSKRNTYIALKRMVEGVVTPKREESVAHF